MSEVLRMIHLDFMSWCKYSVNPVIASEHIHFVQCKLRERGNLIVQKTEIASVEIMKKILAMTAFLENVTEFTDYLCLG